MKDLLLLAADRTIEAGLEGLLSRPQALGIRPVQFEPFTHPGRDPGCFHQAHQFIRPMVGQYIHALVVFDSAWEGAPGRDPREMAHEVRGRLDAVSEPGWSDVIVIEPEVEAWVWSDSPHVDACLGWQGRQPSLRQWLVHEGLMEPGGIKPRDPKEAFRRAVEETRTVPSSALFGKLARTVSVERCTDDAFTRFLQRLRAWFPPS